MIFLVIDQHVPRGRDVIGNLSLFRFRLCKESCACATFSFLFVFEDHHTVICFLWVGAKFSPCTVASVNRTPVEAKLCTLTLESTHFSSPYVAFTLTTVQVPSLALTHKKRFTVQGSKGEVSLVSHPAKKMGHIQTLLIYCNSACMTLRVADFLSTCSASVT
jgi:hypothetical protein